MPYFRIDYIRENGDPLPAFRVYPSKTPLIGRAQVDGSEGWSLELLPDLVIVATSDGVIRSANPVWQQDLGLCPDEMKGKGWRHYIHPEDWADTEAILAPLQRGQPVTRFLCRWRDGAGRWRDLDWSAMLNASDGLIYSVAREVTRDRSAAARLEEIEAVSGVGSWETSVDAGQVYWSPMTCAIHDLPATYQPDIHKAISFFEPQIRPVVEAAFYRLRTEGTPYDLELPFVTATGRRIWVRATGAAEFRAGHMVRAYGTFQDISELRERELHLQAAKAEAEAARQKLIMAVESLPDGFVLYDEYDRLVIANERFRNIYEASAPEMVPGETFENILRNALKKGLFPDAIGREEEWLAQRLESHRNPRGMIEQRLGNGQVLRTLEQRTPDGGTVGLKVDVTELADARERAEEASRTKSMFLATMSHEIRTPLNGMLGMAELLLAELQDPEHRQLVSTIKESGESLLSVLNDILDLAQIDSGRLVLKDGGLIPADLVRRMERLHGARAKEKGLEFVAQMDATSERMRRGDAHRVAQILHNLLSNAVKFTPAGRVELSLQSQGPLVFSVRDTGIGMTAEELGRIFDDFAQAEDGPTRRFGGTGLGMTIVRRLVDRMGGTVEITSEKGNGAVVTVALPLPELTMPPAPMKPVPSDDAIRRLAGKRALIADDNPINLQILEAFLMKLGIVVTSAENGRQAVDLFQRGAYDMLCLDISMPEMDGVTALAEIDRIARAGGGKRPPAVAVTANAMPQHVQEYLSAGFEAHLAKPIRRDGLARTLASMVTL